MALWLVRAGKHGEDENTALEKGLAIIGWAGMPDVSGVKSFEEMKQKHFEIYPDMSPNAVTNYAAQETFDLSVKNSNAPEEPPLREPLEILDEIAALDAESAEVLAGIRGLL